jgi:predicted site-specific integrase-resolvase
MNLIDYLTLKQCAQEYGLPIATLKARTWEGKLPSIKLNEKCRIVRRSDIERYVNDRKYNR